MDNSRLQSCMLRSSEEFPDTQREEGNHALRCVPFLSETLSIPPRLVLLGARSFGQGDNPLDPCFGAWPLRLPGISGGLACGAGIRRVRFSLSL
jgi:hypothetical protein